MAHAGSAPAPHRHTALRNLGRPAEARADLVVAAALLPHDKEIRRALAEAKDEETVAAAVAADEHRRMQALEAVELAASQLGGDGDRAGGAEGGGSAAGRAVVGEADAAMAEVGAAAVTAAVATSQPSVDLEKRSYAFLEISIDGQEVRDPGSESTRAAVCCGSEGGSEGGSEDRSEGGSEGASEGGASGRCRASSA
jgi:hypothetical protein